MSMLLLMHAIRLNKDVLFKDALRVFTCAARSVVLWNFMVAF